MFVEKAPSSPRWKTKVATFSRLFVLTDQLTVTVVVPRPGVSEPERMNSLGSFVKVADAAKLLKPILTEPGRDCVRVYVEREAFEMSLRALHTRLIETAPCAGAEESPFSLDS